MLKYQLANRSTRASAVARYYVALSRSRIKHCTPSVRPPVWSCTFTRHCSNWAKRDEDVI